MKKYIKIALLVILALIFIGTFVFLYQKSQSKETIYDVLTAEKDTLVQTTVATGKIEPRDEVLPLYGVFVPPLPELVGNSL